LRANRFSIHATVAANMGRSLQFLGSELGCPPGIWVIVCVILLSVAQYALGVTKSVFVVIASVAGIHQISIKFQSILKLYNTVLCPESSPVFPGLALGVDGRNVTATGGISTF
jgi:hypothetical protein